MALPPIIMDLCTGKRTTKELEIKRMALRRAKPTPDPIFHSDRGSQYCSDGFGTYSPRAKSGKV